MNQAYENIIERRSCKSYKEQRVPKDVLEKNRSGRTNGAEWYESSGICFCRCSR